jgi:hypothetical protein
MLAQGTLTGFEGLLDLAKTPGGVLLLLIFLVQTLTMLSLVRKSKNENGHTNGNGNGGVAVAKDAMAMQQEYNQHLQSTIDKLLERENRYDATMQAHTITLQTLAQNEGDRRVLHELNGVKMEQVAQGQADVRSDMDKLSQYNIRTVQTATTREIQFTKLVENGQITDGVIIGLLQEIRDLLTSPNGTHPNASKPLHFPTTDADGGTHDALKPTG